MLFRSIVASWKGGSFGMGATTKIMYIICKKNKKKFGPRGLRPPPGSVLVYILSAMIILHVQNFCGMEGKSQSSNL